MATIHVYKKNFSSSLVLGFIITLCSASIHTQNAMFNELAELQQKTQTASGKSALQTMLIEQLTNSEKGTAHEAIIKTLIENEELFTHLNEQVKALAATENSFLNFFTSSDALSDKVFDDAYFKNFLLKSFNKNGTLLGTERLRSQILMPMLSILLPATAIGLAGCLAYEAIENVIDGKWKIEDDWRAAALSAGLFLTGALNSYYIANNALKNQNVYNAIQEKMIHVASFIETTKHIGGLLEQNNEFSELTTALQIAEAPKNAQKLLTILASKTFKGSPSFFSHQGKALVAFKLMQEVKDSFAESIKAVGQLDAYLTLAQYYKTK